MVYLFVAIVILFIGKFIYDSYFSNNTEKNWDAFKKSDPHKAKVVEYSKSFNLNPTATLRMDGYYLSYITGKNYLGEVNTIPVAFIFNKNRLVGQYQGEFAEQLINAKSEDLKNALIEMDAVSDCDITFETSKFSIDNGEIRMRFYEIDNNSNSHLLIDPGDEPNEYIEWIGTILNNALLLKAYKAYYSSAEKDYLKEVGTQETKFDFIEVKFK